MIFNELNTGFRWYNALDKQTRYKEYCQTMCDYALMAPCDDMLPFQIRVPSFSGVSSWQLIYLDGEIDIPATEAYDIITVPDNPFLLVIEISVAGYGVIASTSWQGSVHNTAVMLAGQINVGGIFSAVVIGDLLFIYAPVGSGTAFNGTVTTMGLSMGGLSFSSTTLFAGATDATTGNTIDITSCAENINQYSVDGAVYLQYNGGSLQGCLPKQLDCGKWYSTITDGSTTLYSEVFEVVQFEDLPFEQMKLPLFTAWRFYDAKDKQTRYKDYCENSCGFYLTVQDTALLPFQIKAPDGTTGIQTFKLVGIDEDCEVLLDTTLVTIVTTVDGDRLIYNGDAISNLACGKYYVVINDGVTMWYSELIEIVTDIESFNYLQTDDGVNISTDGGTLITVD